MAQKEINLGRVKGYNGQVANHNILDIVTEKDSPLSLVFPTETAKICNGDECKNEDGTWPQSCDECSKKATCENAYMSIRVQQEDGTFHPSSEDTPGDRFADDDRKTMAIQLDLRPKDITKALGYTPLPMEVYGFEVDVDESDPSSKLKYIEHNANFEPARMVYPTSGPLDGNFDKTTAYDHTPEFNDEMLNKNKINQAGYEGVIGKFDYGSWSNAWFIKDLRVVMLSFEGKELFELCPNDYGYKKKNPDNFTLEGCTHACASCPYCQAVGTGDVDNITDPTKAQGNLMVAIPTVWMKVDTTNPSRPKFYFANHQVDASFHAYAHTNYKGEVMPWLYVSAYDGWCDGFDGTSDTSNKNDCTICTKKSSQCSSAPLTSARMRSLSGHFPTRTQTGQFQIALSRQNNPDYKDPEQVSPDAGKKMNIWDMGDFSNHSLIAMLTLLIGRNTNSQEAFGNGNMNGYNTLGIGVKTIATNLTNALGKEYVAANDAMPGQIADILRGYIACVTSGLKPHPKPTAESGDQHDTYNAFKGIVEAVSSATDTTTPPKLAKLQNLANVAANVAKKVTITNDKDGDYDTDGVLKTGSMNDKGLFWGSNTDSLGVKVFGVEHKWGNIWKRTWGLINNNGQLFYKLTRGPYDGSSADDYCDTSPCVSANTNKDCANCPVHKGTSNYYLPGGAAPGSSGYITDMYFGDFGMMPSATKHPPEDGTAGSATTYYCDYVWVNNGQINFALCGGDSENGYVTLLRVGNGTLYFVSTITAIGGVNHPIGASICCKPFISQ